MAGETYHMISGQSKLEELVDGRMSYGYPGSGYLGRDYYVNNITGSSSNHGTDWTDAMDEASTAITASEAYRAVLEAADTGNGYIRNRIFIQGTSTAYEAITALPSYCDMIGIGADPRGNGAGIARIGADSGTGGGLTGTTTARGLNMRNIQFQAGQSNYAFQATALYRCVIENCAFGTNGVPTAAPAAAFSIGKASGLVVRNCHWINASSKDMDATDGFQITGTHFHNSLVENCYIAGTATGVEVISTCTHGYGSMFKDCYIGWGGSTCAIGVDDNSTDGHIMFVGCYTFATDDYEMTHNGTGRIIGCYAANALAT